MKANSRSWQPLSGVPGVVEAERFRAKACPGRDPGWPPVRVKKTRQIESQEHRFDSIETEKALVNDPFYRDGGSLAAADAERRDATLQVMRFERMQQRHDQACSRRADGMSERAGAAIDVQSVAGDPEVALRRHRHDREGFVDLEQIDITDAPADLVEQLADRRDRGGREPLRLLAVGGVAPDLGGNRQALAIGERSFCQYQRRRTVGICR